MQSMKRVTMIKSIFMSISLLVWSGLFVSCSGDGDKESREYIGRWYRDKAYSNGTEMEIAVLDVSKNTIDVTLYTLKGENLDLLTLAKVSNIKKKTEHGTISSKDGILTISDGSETKRFKYALINNQFVMTDVTNGDVYSVLKVTPEVENIISYLDRLAYDETDKNNSSSSDSNSDKYLYDMVIYNGTVYNWNDAEVEFRNDSGDIVSNLKIWTVEKGKSVDFAKGGTMFSVKFTDDNGNRHQTIYYQIPSRTHPTIEITKLSY